MDIREMDRRLNQNAINESTLGNNPYRVSIDKEEYEEFKRWKKQKAKKPRFRDLKREGTKVKEWQSRVYDERVVLMSKYEKLSHFLATAQVGTKGMALLARQKDIMNEYLHILDERIEEFTHDRDN